MKKDLGIILWMAMAMQSCSTIKTPKIEKRVEYVPKENKNTYTEFNPNPENNEYRKKFLGVKKRSFKK